MPGGTHSEQWRNEGTLQVMSDCESSLNKGFGGLPCREQRLPADVVPDQAGRDEWDAMPNKTWC